MDGWMDGWMDGCMHEMKCMRCNYEIIYEKGRSNLFLISDRSVYIVEESKIMQMII